MDFSFSVEEEQFQQEVVRFFKKEKDLAEGAKGEWDSGLGYGPNCWKIMKKIGQKGWLCPTWPKEYGGLELSYMYRYIIMEQMHHYLNIYASVGAGMAGPVILAHGSKEQKDQFLLSIARGDIEFVLGYTEPQAGSDLAALSIKAQDQGDHFLINGSKLFNTRAHFAQYHWLGARTAVTEPKFKGISLFIVDLNTPGITISPIWTVGGTRTNEVFYDNVKVPKDALVGEVNRGFYYILEALDYERISTVGGLRRDFHEILEYVKSTGRGKDPLIRNKLARLATEIESAQLFALRVAWMLNRNQVPNYEAAMLKMLVSEVEQRLLNTAMQVFGPYGQIQKGSKWSQLDGKYERSYRDSLESMITRGTSEIMRNVIAQRGLGLPRG
ncbi:MAG: acyl-CoA dehydrogenase family protein [Desulfatiglans sp.]|jgi:alkylation response protein AidB-like acyl-CoA dehydrogenase|nr:acyl-CoA dehydrogenase family protein [Desulfatiglans sp.]